MKIFGNDLKTCSFCGKPVDKDRKIIEGPNNSVRICNNCVNVCLDYFNDKAESINSLNLSNVPTPKEFKEYLENGNITHSVNYPAIDMGICSKAGRVAVFHKNIANTITKLAACFGDVNINISDMTNKSKGEVAYTMLDIETAASEDIIKKLQSIDGVFRVRVVK